MVKKILITGFEGYVGSVLIEYLNQKYPMYDLIGYDNSYFRDHFIRKQYPELIKKYIFTDIRDIDEKCLKDNKIDTIIHLAAISNDPISNKFERVTMDVNTKASVRLAQMAKNTGVKNFIFASSCSVYGISNEEEVHENSPTNPLTPYAKSKLLTEQLLQVIADNNFRVTCLRFATACGYSPNIRLDLVLNDFVASALGGKIEILSDGTPWRPLVDVRDMARAMDWAIHRKDPSFFEIVNVGSYNYQVKELAEFVNNYLNNEIEILIKNNNGFDKRSYKVNFNKFKQIASDYFPVYSIENTIHQLVKHLIKDAFFKTFPPFDFRKTHYIRLNTLNSLISDGKIDDDLYWKAQYLLDNKKTIWENLK